MCCNQRGRGQAGVPAHGAWGRKCSTRRHSSELNIFTPSTFVSELSNASKGTTSCQASSCSKFCQTVFEQEMLRLQIFAHALHGIAPKGTASPICSAFYRLPFGQRRSLTILPIRPLVGGSDGLSLAAKNNGAGKCLLRHVLRLTCAYYFPGLGGGTSIA